MHTSMLRLPRGLELTFYDELQAPLLLLAASPPDEKLTRQFRLLTRRFRKDVARFGYRLTECGVVMVKVEPDILDINLDAARCAEVVEGIKNFGPN
jgi:hypothetical protein